MQEIRGVRGDRGGKRSTPISTARPFETAYLPFETAWLLAKTAPFWQLSFLNSLILSGC